MQNNAEDVKCRDWLFCTKEPVHQEVQEAVHSVQEVHLFLGVMPIISHELADDRVVLLFHMGMVILVIGTGPSEGDPQGTAETDEMPIHELAPIVRMERDDEPRVPAETGLQGSDHIDLCFRPSHAPIRDGQGPVEISHCLSSIMTHQVHGQGTRDIQGRVHARLDGDPASQRGIPSVGDPMQTVHMSLCCQEPPDGGRTHLQEEPSGLLIDREMPMGDQVLHKESHACCQTGRPQKGAGTPDGDECLQHKRTIPGWTVSMDILRRISHENTVSQEVPLSCQV
jgi:hypothetical protein